MQKYFISKTELNNKKITSDDVFHIKNVMRFKPSDRFIVSNMEEEYLVSISEISKNFVSFEIVQEIINNNELKCKVDIFQGYPKGDKIEDIIKHSTELGVNSIYPTMMKRSIVKLDNERRVQKENRFQKISKEAAEQSFRKIIPEVKILDLKNIDFSGYRHKILCYEETAKNNDFSNLKAIVKSIEENDCIAVVIGPEGGIDEAELKYLEELGFIACALGPRILRTETASMYILSAISYELELK